MKTRVLVSILFLAQAVQAQVVFYSAPNYRGHSGRFDAASFNTLGVGLAGAVSSVRIPRGYEVIVYDQPNLRGQSLRLNADVRVFNNWNDRIQSARVMRTGGGPVPVLPTRPNPGGSGEVVRVFDGPRFFGASQNLPTGELVNFGSNMDRRASSIQIPRGFTVVLFDQPGFRGSQLRLTESVASLADFGWDNRVRSTRVSGGGSTGPVPVTPAPSNRPGVYLFVYDGYQGGLPVILREGRHSGAALGRAYRNASSLQVMPGYAVRVFDRDGLRGQSYVLRGRVDRLGRIGWDNRIRSLEVVRE